MKKMVVLLTAVLVSLLFVSLVSPCTTFTIKDGNNLVFGRNLDWSTAAGHIEVNKKGLIKQASVGKAEKPFEWVSLQQPGPIPVSYIDLAEFSLNALRTKKLFNSSPYVVADSF